FHDNLGGDNGTIAAGLIDSSHYDEVTGLGSPVVDRLIPDLIYGLQVGTTTVLASSANASVYGEAVTFTATVMPSASIAGTPSGTVQFQVDGSDLGGPVPLSNGTATSPMIASFAVTPAGSPHT